MNGLPAAWQTERLQILDSTGDDIPMLEEIFRDCAYEESWDSSAHPELQEGFEALVHKSLAKTEGLPSFHMQTIRLKENGEAIGYFHLHLGVPDPQTVFLSMFQLLPSFRKRSLGQETLAGLLSVLRVTGIYQRVWLEVFLKNWPALRFWIKCGFTEIVEYRGAKFFTENEHASLVLEKILR